jgi:hypothetical protein
MADMKEREREREQREILRESSELSDLLPSSRSHLLKFPEAPKIVLP